VHGRARRTDIAAAGSTPGPDPRGMERFDGGREERRISKQQRPVSIGRVVRRRRRRSRPVGAAEELRRVGDRHEPGAASSRRRTSSFVEPKAVLDGRGGCGLLLVAVWSPSNCRKQSFTGARCTLPFFFVCGTGDFRAVLRQRLTDEPEGGDARFLGDAEQAPERASAHLRRRSPARAGPPATTGL